ncbi:MAG: sel1 repeat family protein [Deltaproteobacteria bacterium]|jgi:TPR repeat protein|nr:sel1 repeat family protein [Deltaproteobacteria bacterium]
MPHPSATLAYALALAMLLLLPSAAGAQDGAAPADGAAPSDGGQLNPPPGGAAEGQPQVRTLTPEQYMAELLLQIERGDNAAMITLGIIYERGQYGVDINYGKSLEWFQKAADAGVPEGHFNVAYSYQVGEGTAPDFKKALDGYLKAAELKVPLAYLRLAEIYLNGKLGVTADPKAAISYYEQAAAAGILQAELTMADLYLNGRAGVTQDTAKGIQYLNSLADRNVPEALNYLGAIYYLGQWNQAQDTAKSKEYFQKASDLLFGLAMKNLAAYYKNTGDNGKPNLTLALQWAILSVNFGQNNQEMAAFIQELRNGMKAEEISAAEAAAQQWANEKIREVNEANAARARQQQEAAQAPAPKPADDKKDDKKGDQKK